MHVGRPGRLLSGAWGHYFTKVVVAGPGHELKSLDRPEANPEDED